MRKEPDTKEKENQEDTNPPQNDNQTQGRKPPEGEGVQKDSTQPPSEPTEDGEKEEKPEKKGKDQPPEGGGTDIDIDKVVAEDVQFVNEQKNETRNYFLHGEEIAAVKPFSVNHVDSISLERVAEDAKMYVFDEGNINEFLTILHERHLMVMTGEPETGKGTTALYVSHLLRQMEPKISDEAYLVPSLDKTFKIDIREVIDNTEDFGNRVIIFKDAFALENRDILEFFMRLDRLSLESLSEALRDNHIFLIFTADSSTVTGCEAQLKQLKLQCELSPLSDEVLMEGLSRKLKEFTDFNDKTPEDIEKVLDTEDKKLLVETLKTMPAIAQFVDDYLEEVIEENLTLEEALSRVNNLKDWFLVDLANDFETWCFSLTLGLSQCLPQSPGVAWFEFEHLRQEISKHLEREFGLRPPQLPQEPQPPQAVNLVEIISEDTCLKRCRAEVQIDPGTGGDVVQFANERYPELLWDVLLKHNRKILTAIQPLLQEMAEDHNLYMRAHAARILGRIGEIDPFHVTFPLINRWARSNERSQQATVGYLYQGILASKEQRYRDDCLKMLRNLAASQDKYQQWTAIATYKQIGVYNLPLAMRELGQIAERKFTEQIEDAKRIDRILNRVENALRDRPDEVDTIGLALYHEILSEIAQRIFSEDGQILFAIQYAIVSLCLAIDPIQVFEELHQWMMKDKEALAALVALIFLQKEGIAEELEQKVIEIPGTGTDDELQAQQCNPIIISMVSSENSVLQMAKFLAAVFDSFSTYFPRRLRRYLRKSFLMHLKKWAKDAYPIEGCRSAMEKLFVELLRMPNKVLYEELYNRFLNGDADFTGKDPELYSFANGVLERFMESPKRRFPWEIA